MKIPSQDGKYMYSFGLIDFLTDYNTAKYMETKIKRLQQYAKKKPKNKGSSKSSKNDDDFQKPENFQV
jgi:hypothetical protein